MNNVYDINAPRKATNLSVNTDLLEQARARNINLSATLETALAQLVLSAKQEEWVEQNREAIERLNKMVEEHGTFADSHRVI